MSSAIVVEKNNVHQKIGGAPERTHRLRNRHGPMVAQRCLEVKTNSPRKFALVSCFKLPKRTQNELRFGLILFEMTSYQFALRFRLKYIEAFNVCISVSVNVLTLCLLLCMCVCLFILLCVILLFVFNIAG